MTYFTKCQLSRCGKDVKSVLQAEGCQVTLVTLVTRFLHHLQVICAVQIADSSLHVLMTRHVRGQLNCSHKSTMMNRSTLLYPPPPKKKTRALALEDKNDLKLALLEYRSGFSASGQSWSADGQSWFHRETRVGLESL